jgi:hypothetical protein
MYSLPLKFTFDYGAPNGEASFLNIQPVIPITVGDWNFINRIIAPLIDTPGQVAGTPEIPNPPPATGPPASVTSIIPCSFHRPNQKGSSGVSVRPSCCPRQPINSSDLKSGAPAPPASFWSNPSGAPTAVLSGSSVSFAGDDDRASVNQTLIEPFLNYNLDKGWYLIADIIITANWQADSSNRWTVPLGGGVGKLLKIGNQAINVRTEAYYNVEKPDSAPDWQWGFTVQFLFPK